MTSAHRPSNTEQLNVIVENRAQQRNRIAHQMTARQMDKFEMTFKRYIKQRAAESMVMFSSVFGFLNLNYTPISMFVHVHRIRCNRLFGCGRLCGDRIQIGDCSMTRSALCFSMPKIARKSLGDEIRIFRIFEFGSPSLSLTHETGFHPCESAKPHQHKW